LQALLLKNATVYIGSHSVARAEAAMNSLIKLMGNHKVFLLQMDLADLPSVKKAAEEFQK
jgi:NAD(P)-dependent dehydrogenase (short-subunit alcohol dehydrogenase family)